jgi:hypothetical protein
MREIEAPSAAVVSGGEKCFNERANALTCWSHTGFNLGLRSVSWNPAGREKNR